VAATAEGKAPAAILLVQPYLQLPTPNGMTVMWETDRPLPSRVEYGTTAALDHGSEITKASQLHEVRLGDLEAATTYYYRVRSGELVSAVYHFRTAPPPGTPRWRMIVYGDSRSNPAIHHTLTDLMAKQNPDLIVHTGDIVVNGKDHDTWRKEFFDPIAPLAHSVPWVSTIGNHERDADNYFSYMALPGNEHYFNLDYANASIVCLDSNSWIAKGRDSAQFQWMTDFLGRPRAATWTFVVFHHPLFSAHLTRPINSLRWDWAPFLLDPANRVDGVLTGHDHFYARNFRMGRLTDVPQAGVLFLTTAGGGASLYKTKARDYVAREQVVHHFVVFDFDGDRVTLTAIDLAGNVIERFVLTKGATPPEDFCAYEVEELRQMLRLALAGAKPVQLPESETGTIELALRVPTHFVVPVSGQLDWEAVPGWKLKRPAAEFKLEPGDVLTIPLEATVAAGPFPRNPLLTVRFEPGKFRNNAVELSPFQLTGPEQIGVAATPKPVTVDGKLEEEAWRATEEHALLGLAPVGGRGDGVRFLADRDWLYVAARLDDPAGKVKVTPADPRQEGSRLVYTNEHVRIVLSDGKQACSFAVTPSQVRFSSGGSEENEEYWHGAAAAERGAWCVEMAIPRKLFAGWSQVRVNAVHRRQEGQQGTELHLCPAYTMGNDADRLPDFRPADQVERFARLVFN
jgi:hypothetical protein